MRTRGQVVRLLAVAAALGMAPAVSTAQRTVTPGGPWVPNVMGSGPFVGITGANPRNGNGSLQLSVSGDLFDWSWFNLFSGDPATTAGWGQLSQLSQVGFDWYRVAMGPAGDAPWQAQTPVLRLYVRSGPLEAPVFSELVWERWYTLGASPAPTDQWVSENATSQMFWRFVAGSGYTIDNCANSPAVTPGIPLATAAPSTWGNGSNCYGLGDAVVYGIGVGLGSYWPHAYLAYVDDVRLGFGTDPLAVHDNFELASTTTPEPASLVLLGSGLAGIGAAMRRRRRRAVAPDA